MGIATSWADMFFRNRDAFASQVPLESSAWLSIGTLDYDVSPEAAQRNGFYNKELYQNFSAGGALDGKLHKNLCAAMVRKLGYGSYLELDINDRADMTWDLNKPVPTNEHGRFDLVYDGGSLEHIFNPFQGCANLLRMTKLGGRIVHSQGVGDQTDQGYWTFNPGFVLDFYRANGCILTKLFIMDLDGTEFDVTVIPGRGGLIQYIGRRATIMTSMQLLHHALDGDSRWWSQAVKRILPKIFGPRVGQSPNFSMIAVFEKRAELPEIMTAMQAMYAGDSVLS
ncbi:MAG: methyltransferase protein [Xanthobacteraceae bacterium]|nr:methyltransferase protein [Xanthobacteraceae bacterium]